MNFAILRDRAFAGEPLSRWECRGVLKCPREQLEELSQYVYEVRYRYKGNRVSVQILTNAKSGNCDQNCAYCAQSAVSRAKIEKYPLVPFGILKNTASVALKKGINCHCIGLSGMHFTDEQIDAFCEHIHRLGPQTPICCSIGFVTRSQAKKLKEAGITRINHNLNTGRNFYPRICTTHTYSERIANIEMLQALGFEICCGGIVGMGESDEDVIDMLLDVRQIAPECVPINFLIPIQGTPLGTADTQKLTPEYCLKVLMLARLLNPRADVRCAAGRELYLKNHHAAMFQSVSSIFAAGYLTASGDGIEKTIKLIQECGFEYVSR
ncbi:MAG: biotin synthase BioB [Puniceicoccales bacterium]|jgi:biotin synthase|nr:biotin synthase BioB [Puniceicoccales bacterium]